MGVDQKYPQVVMQMKNLMNQAYIHLRRYNTQVMNRWNAFLGQLIRLGPRGVRPQ